MHCSYNWFKKLNSRKKCCYYWNGLYKCVSPGCVSKFQAYIENEPESGDIIIMKLKWQNYNSEPTHQQIKYESRCTGEIRKNLALELSANGVQNTLTKNVLENLSNSFSYDCKYILLHFNFNSL